MDSCATPTEAVRWRFGVLTTTVCILVGAALGYAALGTGPRHFADEGFHAPQILELSAGHFEVLRTTTMLPTYHLILAGAERLYGHHDLRLLRFVNLLGSLFLPLFIWRLSSMNSIGDPGRRAVQWFFMPLLFPFFFLIYTDAWALVAVLATIYCALKGRSVLAAFAGLAAALIRQDMIIWVGLAWMLVLLHDFKLAEWRRDPWGCTRSRMQSAGPLSLVLVLFALFFVWNHGVAVGDRMQQDVGFNVTNVFYFLLCAWAIFLPLNLEAVPRVLRLMRGPVCLALLAVGFVLYMLTFANDHPYNNYHYLGFYLHNDGLHLLTKYRWVRAAAFVPMAWMVLTVVVTRLAEPRLYLLYFLAPLSVGLHPVIEQRYYLAALTLFHVWRPSVGEAWENSLLAIYAVASVVIVAGIASERFFL
jgi:DIE2/ALG10 family.